MAVAVDSLTLRETPMKHLGSMAAWVAALTVALPVSAQPPQPMVKDGVAEADSVTITAKIEAVDKTNRTVTLKGPLGRTLVMRAGEQVKNFAWINPGDELVVKYTEAVSLKLEKGIAGRSETVTTTGPVTAPAGSKPGMAMANQTTIVANVERIDSAHNRVLLQGPKGGYAEVKVKDPDVMKEVKVGDKVVATYTEAVVVDVQATQKKK